jgi:hypothetical protein
MQICAQFKLCTCPGPMPLQTGNLTCSIYNLGALLDSVRFTTSYIGRIKATKQAC